MRFPETGDYVFPAGLATVHIDRGSDTGEYLKHRDVHVVVMVRGDAAAVLHRDPAGRRHADIPDPLPVDDVHDPEPGGVRLGPRRNVVPLLDRGGVRHDATGTEHEVARPAERMLAVVAGPVAADGAERPEPQVDLVPHGAHARRDAVPDDRRLRPELV